MKTLMNELFSLTKRTKSGEILSEYESKRLTELTETVTEFIKKIDNDYASTCIKERYINAKPWHQIADELGQLTNDSVRKCCERTIRKYS